MLDVVCVGSATKDVFLTIHQKIRSITYGSKVLIKQLEIHTGGGGSNAAVALSKFGLKVGYLGKTGDDEAGRIIRRELKENNITILNKNKSKLPTDQAFILNSDQEEDRIIYVYKGSSEDLKIKEIPKKIKTKWFYLGTLLGKSFSVLVYLSRYAQKNNQKILFNPSTYLANQGKKRLKEILKTTDLLILNKEEANLLLKTKKKEGLYLLKKIKKEIKGSVVITNGSKKIYALHQRKIYSLQPPRVKVVHTAGAGDAFNSGLLAGLIKGYSFSKALQLGQANALAVIQQIGTKNKLLKEKEAKEMIKKSKIKVFENELK